MSTYKYTPLPVVEKSNVVRDIYQPTNKETLKADSNINGLESTTGSLNWSGYVAKGNFAMMQADFVQPTINPSNPSYTHESTWIGFGGYNSKKLVQTGTAMNTDDGSKNYYAWYEYLGTSVAYPEIRFTNIKINARDNIHTYCSFQKANNKFNAYVANNTNGTSQSVLVTLPVDEYFDDSTAEFINEKPTVSIDNGLTNYGTTNWTNCQIYKMSNIWVNLGSTTYDKVIMYN